MGNELSKLVRVPRMERESEERCVSLVGIAGAGKSTLGEALGRRLGWAHVDTDRLLEAYYGVPLQEIMDNAGLEGFLAAEEHLAANLRLNRTVISTGGSVVYSAAAVARLRELGPVVHLHVGLGTFEARVGDGSGRGLAIGEKTRAELWAEREPLYRAAADLALATDELSPDECLERLAAWLAERGIPEKAQA
jgi:shikimate kinase